MHAELEPSMLVKRARVQLNMSQREFAQYLSKNQGMVSRYENGESEPPRSILMHCMHILSGSPYDPGRAADEDAGLEELKNLIDARLGGPARRDLRLALKALIGAIVPEK